MLSALRTRLVASILLSLVAGAWVVSASGCNTVKGAGRDIESAGEAGQDVIRGDEP